MKNRNARMPGCQVSVFYFTFLGLLIVLSNRLLGKLDFAPGKVEVSSEESLSFLGGKFQSVLRPEKALKKATYGWPNRW